MWVNTENGVTVGCGYKKQETDTLLYNVYLSPVFAGVLYGVCMLFV